TARPTGSTRKPEAEPEVHVEPEPRRDRAGDEVAAATKQVRLDIEAVPVAHVDVGEIVAAPAELEVDEVAPAVAAEPDIDRRVAAGRPRLHVDQAAATIVEDAAEDLRLGRSGGERRRQQKAD